MALESPIERVKTAVAAYCGTRAPTDDQTMDYLRRVLEFDFPELLSREFSAIDKSWSFRAMDRGDFRRIENATLDDALKAADSGAGPAVLETVPLDLGGQQCALAMLTFAAEEKAELKLDICADANPANAETGSFLAADEGVDLTDSWGKEILLDVYPTDHLVVQLTLTGGLAVYSVRMRLTCMGRGSLAKYQRAAALLAAAYWFDYRWNEAVTNGNALDVQRAFEYKAGSLRRQALGLIAPEQKVPTASAVQVSRGPVNAYYERLKGIWAKRS